MRFLIQDNRDIDNAVVLDILNKQSFHKYSLVNKDIREFPDNFKEVVPIGNTKFVEAWLRQFYNVDKLNPIEIPKCLRVREYLKRDYTFCFYDELPKTGTYFVKDVSGYKNGSYDGVMENIKDYPFDKSHIYQLSEHIKIYSEWRVYILQGEIDNIVNYDGRPYNFPDMNLINKANFIYSQEKDYPKSITMDVAITDRGTCILEVHPFVAIGLYSTLWGNNLLYAYKDGIEYFKKYNTEITIV